jgi:UDP-N-acetyl-D-mannosaminuronic acid transferase (WecB/TagA/CpsF family)
MRRLRLEWLYRWAQEPGRLRRRYTIGIARFSARVLRQARLRRS